MTLAMLPTFMIPYLARRLLLLLSAALLLSGCQQAEIVPEKSAAATPWQHPAPAWLPIHPNPRVGDYAIHRQLDARGTTELLRRSEVLAVTADHIELRHSYSADDTPHNHYQLDRDGRVLRAWVVEPGRAGTRPRPVAAAVQRTTKRLAGGDRLTLVSGSFSVSRIVSQSIELPGGEPGRQVYYLSAHIPFSTLVSLSSNRPISHQQAVRLLGQIAVPPEQASSTAAGKGPVTSGWVLMRWGRGSSR